MGLLVCCPYQIGIWTSGFGLISARLSTRWARYLDAGDGRLASGNHSSSKFPPLPLLKPAGAVISLQDSWRKKKEALSLQPLFPAAPTNLSLDGEDGSDLTQRSNHTSPKACPFQLFSQQKPPCYPQKDIIFPPIRANKSRHQPFFDLSRGCATQAGRLAFPIENPDSRPSIMEGTKMADFVRSRSQNFNF
jgi:hypothetical protein